jgi:hypothetical protein
MLPPVNPTIKLLFIACLFLSQLSACTLNNSTTKTPDIFWNENSSGIIQTNDIARLQKVVPFTIILPEYLPNGLNSYKLVMTMHK